MAMSSPKQDLNKKFATEVPNEHEFPYTIKQKDRLFCLTETITTISYCYLKKNWIIYIYFFFFKKKGSFQQPCREIQEYCF